MNAFKLDLYDNLGFIYVCVVSFVLIGVRRGKKAVNTSILVVRKVIHFHGIFSCYLGLQDLLLIPSSVREFQFICSLI